MRKSRAIPVIFSAGLLLLAAACGGAEPTSTPVPAEPTSTPVSATGPTPTPAPSATPALGAVAERVNLRFLISDEANAIERFQSLKVSIGRIGLLRGGESGKWIEMPPRIPVVDLVQLQGENAQEVWSGTLPEGQYTKVFVYVDTVEGVLRDEPDRTVNVKLPSNKLQISKTFEVAPGTVVSFVYDLTVVAAGNPRSGIKYILKPQIGRSGADQRFRELEPPTPAEGPRVKGELAFQLEGDVSPGGAATLTLTHQGNPLAGVPVSVKDAGLGNTNQAGQVAIQIPADAEELELEAKLKGELEIDFTEVPPPAPEASGELTLQLDGDVTLGGDVTITLTYQGTPLANVPIELNDEQIGVTDASGLLSFQIPTDIEEMKLEVELEGEFELKFREDEVEPQEFRGTITALTVGAELESPWTITIPGMQDPVTVFVLKLDGTPEIGSEVEVEGVFIEGVIIDAKVKVEEPEGRGNGNPGRPRAP